MHPILFTIPLHWATLVVFVALFFAGGLISARFKPADRDSSYLAAFLGLAVKWGEVDKPWNEAIKKGLSQAAIAAVLGIAIAKAAPGLAPGSNGIPLHIYGVMMAIAFIVGIAVSTKQATHEGLPPVPVRAADGSLIKDKQGKLVTITSAELVNDLTFYLLVAGLVGSRILYIITRWDAEYSKNPAKIFRVWEGGLVWYGGLIAATLVAVWFVRKHRIAFLPYGDVLVPMVSLGHGIGRLGCFAAGCCFGNPAAPGFPLTVQFPENSPAWQDHLHDHLIGPGSLWSAPVYPTQIMEAAAETLIFFALLWIRSRKRFHGQVLLSYFGMYAVWRFINEMFRGDDIRSFFFRWPSQEHPMLLTTSQGVSIGMAVTAVVLLVVLLRKRGQAHAHAAAEPTT